LIAVAATKIKNTIKRINLDFESKTLAAHESVTKLAHSGQLLAFAAQNESPLEPLDLAFLVYLVDS